jgi:hypothetical protein
MPKRKTAEKVVAMETEVEEVEEESVPEGKKKAARKAPAKRAPTKAKAKAVSKAVATAGVKGASESGEAGEAVVGDIEDCHHAVRARAPRSRLAQSHLSCLCSPRLPLAARLELTPRSDACSLRRFTIPSRTPKWTRSAAP